MGKNQEYFTFTPQNTTLHGSQISLQEKALHWDFGLGGSGPLHFTLPGEKLKCGKGKSDGTESNEWKEV